MLGKANEEFHAGGYGPFSGHEIDPFLRSLAARLHEHGVYQPSDPAPSGRNTPSIHQRPLLFLRQRAQGFVTALEAIVEDLPNREDLPTPLCAIVGATSQPSDSQPSEPAPGAPRLANEDPDILFTKPANEEQAQIVRRLEGHGAAMVQGPPGTGKTHTIANLIGHLLAQGKRVLVTSHTAKALDRVREVIVEELQPLAVSVLTRDTENRAQLEHSVREITRRLSENDAGQLRREAHDLATRRRRLLGELATTRRKLRNAIHAEYRELVVAGEGIRPVDAAREVACGRDQHGWIPAPVSYSSDLTLNSAEVQELYETNTALTADHERELSQPLPPTTAVLTPPQFEALVRGGE